MRRLVVVAVLTLCCACGSKGGSDGGVGGGAGGGSHLGGGGGGSATGGGSTGGGSAGGGGNSTGGGSAVGGGTGTGGGAGTQFNIQFSTTCPAFAPCSATPSGAYTYTALCVDSSNPFPSVSQACTGLVFEDLMGHAQGTASFTGTDVTRTFTAHASGSVLVPAACAASGCGIVQQTLRAYFGIATCFAPDGGDTCACTFSHDFGTTGTAPYSLTGNTLTTDPGTANARTFDVCGSPTGLQYRETGNAPLEIGVSTLSK